MTAPRGSRAGLHPGDAAPLVPALLVGLFAAWAGTFSTGTSATAAITAHGAVLTLGVFGVAVSRGQVFDPLGLGRAGRFLPWALVIVVALAWWVSPVRRAGVVGVVLFPAFLAIPAAVARCWSRSGWSAPAPDRAVLGTRGMAAVIAGVSFWSLGSWLLGSSPLPAEPLGHHLFLSTWVVTLLPLAALPLAAPGRRRRWLDRVLGGVALAAGIAAILATGSLAGLLALAVEAAVVVLLMGWTGVADRHWRRLVERAAALVLVIALGVIVFAVWSGDPSLQARAAYWRGGWEGTLERPVTGFGPGASAWTLSAFIRPVPGVNPPGEVVGEAHLLPLAVTYEIGFPGLVLALGVVALFGIRRVRGLAGSRERAGEGDGGSALTVAGLTGVAGAATMGCATADWRVLALPVAASVAAGAALAGTRALGKQERIPAGTEPVRRCRLRAVLAVVYVLAAGFVLLPLDRAHLHYDRALRHHEGDRADPEGVRAAVATELDAAVRLDPEHPLYGFHAGRESRLAEQRASGRSRAHAMEAARRTMTGALDAAAEARGVAALWLRAGAAAAVAEESSVAGPAFEAACGLDPLGAAAPFGLLAVGSPLHRPEALGARALAAEPRLGAALLWDERPELRERVLRVLETTEGIDAGWREEMVRRVTAVHSGAPEGPVATIAVVVDGTPAGALSLHAFRRLPWRVELVPVPVRRRGAEVLADLPPATTLHGTDPRLFPPTCTGSFSPQTLRKTLWKTW